MPTHLRVLRGNPAKRPLPMHEPQPQIAVEAPQPPDFLDGYARDEWIRVAEELTNMRLMAMSDMAALAAYCTAFALWRTAALTLDAMARRDPIFHGLMLRAKTGTPMQNPLVHTVSKAASDMVRYAAEFGLTPSARARIAAGPYGDGRPSKFGDLLA